MLLRNTPKNQIICAVYSAVNQFIHDANDYRSRNVFVVEKNILNDITGRKASRFDASLVHIHKGIKSQIAELEALPESLEQKAALAFWKRALTTFNRKAKDHEIQLNRSN